jgi:hypothetical protein
MNAEEHAVALQRIEFLCAIDPARGTTLGEELDALATKVMEYEAAHFPFPQQAPPTVVATTAAGIEARRLVGRVLTLMVALDEFYSITAAIRWLESPQRALNDRLPADLILSAEGAAEVMNVIEQMRDGVYV